MIDNYTPGQGCECHAHSESECGCDVDWTPREVYELRKLERELAAVTAERDELKSKYRTHHDEAERITNEIRRVSSVCHKLREQRDRLAEALRSIANGSHCMQCYGGDGVWIAQQALAAVKGGSDD